jgi:hypothetical protein
MKDRNQAAGHEQLKARWRLAMANFLRAELRTSKIFITLAMRTSRIDDQARYVKLARTAYLSVVHFASKAALDQTEKTRLTEELDHVNSTLAWLETSFDVAESSASEPEWLTSQDSPSSCAEIQAVARRAQRFEVQCGRTRDYVSQMLVQNRRLMNQRLKRPVLPDNTSDG